jgi:hypothetical protein
MSDFFDEYDWESDDYYYYYRHDYDDDYNYNYDYDYDYYEDEDYGYYCCGCCRFDCMCGDTEVDW